jgi:WD40 repeat protein
MTTITTPAQAARPYPGLRPFSKGEADIFFGREEQTDQILDKLSHSRFLGVVGTSGCGKSSLAMAGLIPALETGLIAGAGFRWRVAVFKPADRPLTNLARALLEPGVLGAEREPAAPGGAAAAAAEPDQVAPFVLTTLRRGPLGLADVLAGPLTPGGGPALPAGQNLLLLVDQFEEIFRFRKEGDLNEANAFIALLLAGVEQDRVPIYVVLTMRSDYLGDCALFSGLPEALNDSQFLTPRLTRDQRRAAIEGPARVFGGRVEPALVGRLLNDMGPEPDQLPLMQHALMRLWDLAEARARSSGAPRKEIVLTLKDYQAIGGLAEALDTHAEEAFATLGAGPDQRNRLERSPNQAPPLSPKQRIVEALFRCLSEREYSGRDALLRDIRHPTRLRTVADVAGVPLKGVVEVVEVFRAPGLNFLTPRVGVPLEADTMLDVTHESLIRRWRRLQAWVEDEARSAETYRRLEESARLYYQGQASLLVPPELVRVLDWRAKRRPSRAWARRYGGDFGQAIRFLDQSQQAWRVARARQRRNRFLLRGLVASLIAFVLLAAGFFRERGLRTRAEQAETKAKNALEGERSERTRAENAERSAQAALKKSIGLSNDLQKEQGKLLSSIKTEQRAALNARMLLLLNESQIVSPTNPQQGVLLAAQAVKEAARAQEGERDPPRGEPALDQLVQGSETALRRALLNISGRGLKGHRGRVTALSLNSQDASLGLSQDGFFATAGIDGRLVLWDLKSGQPAAEPLELPRLPGPGTPSPGRVDFLKITPDGRRLVAANSSFGTIRRWDLRPPSPFRWADLSPTRKVHARFMSRDGRWLVTSDARSYAHPQLWDLLSDDLQPIELGVKRPEILLGYSISDDGNWLAFCRADASGYMWDLRKAHDRDFGPVELVPVPVPDGSPRPQAVHCEFSRGGRRLVVCLNDATARLYDPSAPDREPTTVALHPPGPASHQTVLTDRRGLWAVTTTDSGGTRTPDDGRSPAAPVGPSALVPMAAPGNVPGSSRGQPVDLWDLSSAPEVPPPIRLEHFVAPRDSTNFQIDAGAHQLVVNADDGRFLHWHLMSQRRRAGAGAGQGPSGIGPIQLHPGPTYPGIPPARVRQFTISRDGRWVAARVSGTGFAIDSRPCVWDLEASSTGVLLRGHEGAVTTLAFSADSRYLVTTSQDTTSRVWDLSDLSPSAQPFRVLGAPGSPSMGHPGLLSKDQRWLALVHSGGFAELTDLAAVGPASCPRSITPRGARARSLTASADGRWLAVIAEDQDVTLRDLTAPDPASHSLTLTGRRNAPVSLVTDSQGQWFAATIIAPAPAAPAGVGLTDPTARQALVDRLADLNAAYTNAKLTDDNRKSLLSNDARTQYAGKLNKSVDALTDAERADADALAAGDQSYQVRLWKLGEDRKSVRRIALKHPEGTALLFDPMGRLVIFRGNWMANEIVLWKLTDADPSASPIALVEKGDFRYLLEGLWPSHDGSRLVTWQLVFKKAGGVNQLNSWNLGSADPQHSRRLMDEPADIVNLPFGPRLYPFSQNNRWWLDLTRGKVGLKRLDSDPNDGRLTLVAQGKLASLAPAMDPSGRWLVTSSVDDGTRLWDLNADEPQAYPIPLEMGGSPVTAVFSPDGRWLATGSGDTARLWDLKDVRAGGLAPRSILAPGLNGGSIDALAVSTQARWLGLLWNDGVIRLGEWKPGETVARLAATLPGYTTVARQAGLSAPGVAVTPDGSRVVSVADDSVEISTVPRKKLMEIAQRAVGRNLTREEWKKYFPDVGSYQRTFESLPEPDALAPDRVISVRRPPLKGAESASME